MTAHHPFRTLRRSKLLGLVLLTSSSIGCAPQERAAVPTPSATQVTGAPRPTQVATAEPEKAKTHDPKSLAEGLARGVGVVTRTSTSVPGPVVVALEERHNSRIGQVQHAVMLVRMHDKHQLSSVVLEGYLKGDPVMETAWFTHSVKGNTPEARASVAVQLLAQGDISAVEFLKLVYPEVNVNPGEERVNYDVEPPTSIPMIGYLQAIARVNEAKALEFAKPYKSAETFKRMSGEEKAASAREMKQYAEKNGVSVDDATARAMNQYITFFERRMASNQTIADMLGQATPRGAIVVATNIGADHSNGLSKLLDGGKRPYAVISPRYVPGDNTKGDLSDEMYDRKNQALPVFRLGLSQLIFDNVKGKKPPSVIAEPKKWLQATAELRGLVASVTEAALAADVPTGPGASGKRPMNDKVPFGFTESDLEGKRVKLELNNIEVLRRKDNSRALLIPVVFKDSGQRIWVGAQLSESSGARGKQTVEEIVLAALQTLEAEQGVPTRDEGPSGLTQITRRVAAYIGTDPAVIQKALMSGV